MNQIFDSNFWTFQKSSSFLKLFNYKSSCLTLISLLLLLINNNSIILAENTIFNQKDNNSTELIIQNILLNQSNKYSNDELILEQLLTAANQTQPSPQLWRSIVNLLTKGLNITHIQQYHLLNNNQIDNDNDENCNDNITITKSSPKRLKKPNLESAIDEFPKDFMSDDLRRKGGFIVHLLIFIYLSLALAVICDDYFLKSLEYISEALHLPSDIAGATFMAIGTSAPELFTSVIGVFISDNDIGTGTIVGSAVFNLIAIPGACGFAAYYNLKNMPKINPFPIIRDTIFYVLTIITLIICIKDNRVDWIESITLIALYIVYIIIMYFNAQLSNIIDNNTNDNDKLHRISSQQYIKNAIHQNDKKLNENESMNQESQPLLLTDDSVKRLSPPPAYQSGGNTFVLSSSNQQQQQPSAPIASTNEQLDLSKIHLTLSDNGKFKEIKSDNQSNDVIKKNGITETLIELEQQQQQQQQSSDTDEIDADWSGHPIIQFLLLPFRIIFLFTLPKPTRFCFVLTFVSSIIWIACLTYFIVWMVTLVGYTLAIPDTISGITVLAAGTSIPELISSYLIVKKAGLADMAICNSIGSNIFDILFCLGLPWLLKSSILIIKNGINLSTIAQSFIPIQSTALPITSLTLLLTIGAMIMIFRTSKWRLNLKLGILCLLVYILFVVTSISLELNV